MIEKEYLGAEEHTQAEHIMHGGLRDSPGPVAVASFRIEKLTAPDDNNEDDDDDHDDHY